MDLAEGQAIGHDRLTVRSSIRNDVGRVQQFSVLQSADAALASVCQQDARAECVLMKPTFVNERA